MSGLKFTLSDVPSETICLVLKKVILRILTGKKYCQIKLKRLQKVGIQAFGLLLHQMNSL